MDKQHEQATNIFANPKIRFGIGISGALIMAAVAIVYLEGITRQVVLIVAILDAVITPKILKMASEDMEEAESGDTMTDVDV